MRILLGTTNPSKVKRFSNLLKGYDVEFVTLKDLAITDEPEENGTNSPLIRIPGLSKRKSENRRWTVFHAMESYRSRREIDGCHRTRQGC